LKRKILLRDRLHFVLEALQNRSRTYSFSKELSGVVVSTGGVASTAMIDHIGKFLTINDAMNADGLKHRPRPPSEVDNEIPVLYLWGDFHSIATSLATRDYLPHQAIRLGNVGFFLVPAVLRSRMLKKTMDRQKRSWLRHYRNVLVLHYDEIWESRKAIGSHFNIDDPSFILDFPPKIKRQSLGMTAAEGRILQFGCGLRSRNS
jgi:hypothetical protein